MIRLAYNLALLGGVTLGAPVLAAHAWRGRSRAIARARLGLGGDWRPPEEARGGIWLHALSVGEFLSAWPLIKGLKARYPDQPLVVSLSTAQGLEAARRRLADEPGVHLLVRTLDLPWLVERVVEGLRPRLFILVEGDAWPNLQWSLGRHGTPRLLVNARLSPRSFRRYKLAPALARELLGGFELILAQSEQDRQRLAGLGLGPAGLETGGNLKFDAAPEAASGERCRELRQKWSLGERPVVVAGSTHPGEEEVCLQALERLGGRFEDLTLVLAPRDTRRGKDLARLAEAWGWSACRISQGAPTEDCRVIILDRMGLLARAYSLGRAAFVGGSLVAQGGHNPLEPAVAGLPVLFGPHMEDFAGVAQGLERAGAAHTVQEPEDLAAWWDLWLSDPEAAGKAGEAGRGLCRDNQGVVARTLDRVEALLSAGPGAARP